MQLTMGKCRNRLALIWFIGFVILLFVLFLQTVFGNYGGKVAEIWEWFLPNIMPTLGLMLGVYIANALSQSQPTMMTRTFLFWLTFGLSIAYLLLLALTILLASLVWHKPTEIYAFLKQSHLWLVPLQGLVSASIGFFFVQKEQD